MWGIIPVIVSIKLGFNKNTIEIKRHQYTNSPVIGQWMLLETTLDRTVQGYAEIFNSVKKLGEFIFSSKPNLRYKGSAVWLLIGYPHTEYINHHSARGPGAILLGWEKHLASKPWVVPAMGLTYHQNQVIWSWYTKGCMFLVLLCLNCSCLRLFQGKCGRTLPGISVFDQTSKETFEAATVSEGGNKSTSASVPREREVPSAPLFLRGPRDARGMWVYRFCRAHVFGRRAFPLLLAVGSCSALQDTNSIHIIGTLLAYISVDTQVLFWPPVLQCRQKNWAFFRDIDLPWHTSLRHSHQVSALGSVVLELYALASYYNI